MGRAEVEEEVEVAVGRWEERGRAAMVLDKCGEPATFVVAVGLGNPRVRRQYMWNNSVSEGNKVILCDQN